MNDHSYGKHVPITIGTLHIDMIIHRATKEELEQISIAWGRGLKLSCQGNNPFNSKGVNVVVEPPEDADTEDNYAVPAYSFLKSISR